METIDQIKKLPVEEPKDFDVRRYAGELVLVHVHWKRVWSKKIPTYIERTEKGRKQAWRWMMKRIPWAFTDEALKAEGITRKKS